ncbi:MAG: SUMF1/EgtB/PvdO family nonheme iron enzyme [Acidobacteria bacterium]|nr:SUMF1/EgtB/PvdO family nonheme iron enzyme [Acidobacteriota bacterium]
MLRISCACFLIIFLTVGLSVYHRKAEADAAQASNHRINSTDGAEMVYISPGTFLMGSDAAELDQIWRKFNWPEDWKQHTKSEQPAHQVRVDGFWMYRRNVTVAQYRKFCAATKRAMPPAPSWGWDDAYPIVNVSWEDAKAYCKWAGGRLPYEAEWEYAARGGNTGLNGSARTVFVWGDDYPRNKVANLADTSFKQAKVYHPNYSIFEQYDDGYTYAAPVGLFLPNGFGLYDMAGNVLQWCEDWYDKEYYGDSPAANPHGASRGELRVLRGGAFDTIPAITRISRRLGNRPDIHHDEKGFRCVQER